MDRPLVWLGVLLVATDVLVLALGLLLGHAGRGGRLLPGDIVISRPGFTFVFPIVTSVVLSIVLTLVVWLVAVWRR
ncbi:MAG: DUF2905 domain-containing protein [Armatimonadota bacterium]